MLLTSLIIVLREVLEAAVLLSLLLLICRRMGYSLTWLPGALALGALFAWGYSLNLEAITDWQEGVGQELLNAGLELLVVIGLFTVAWVSSFRSAGLQPRYMAFTGILAMVIIAALTQELAELLIYLDSALSVINSRGAVLAGATMGMGIGFSLGVLLYVFLSSLQNQTQKLMLFFLLALSSAGKASQAMGFLMQADWLESSLPLWNSADLLSERSVAGEILYAIMGYEATPTAGQVVVYVICLVSVSILYGRFRGLRHGLPRGERHGE